MPRRVNDFAAVDKDANPDQRVERAISAEVAGCAAEDHAIPLERPGRGALGALSSQKQLDR